MKRLSRILTMVFCCAPFGLVYGAPVATTDGSNLTSFNPSNAYNNQWSTMTNGRYDADNTSNKTAKANFGNCNSMVLRCAQPKCGNGGCADATVASSIVAGCVKANESCKKYGDDLVNFMTAQLVADANVKINQQNLAMQQAAAEAQAAATAAANAQSQQQISMMQQQMQQMQQQMQQQQAESAQQLQAALAQQNAQSQQALNEMKAAATSAAMENEAGISAYEQDAINRGISSDVLERKKISGQVMTEIEDAEISLKTLDAVLQSSFEYAHCDKRGNNCEGPKRIKKWRELASGFVEPYYNSIKKIYDALDTARLVGVDLTQIYMMLNNSCSSWAQYLCPNIGVQNSVITYDWDENDSKSNPKVCPKDNLVEINKCITDTCKGNNSKACEDNCKKQYSCQPCVPIKNLTDDTAVFEGWVNAETTTDEGNTTVVACASGALDTNPLFAPLARKKAGKGLVSVDMLEMWLSQTEPNVKMRKSTIPVPEKSDYCYTQTSGGTLSALQKASLSKSVDVKKLCCDELKPDNSGCGIGHNEEECAFINPIYAICDTHPYNAGKNELSPISSTSDANEVFCTKEDMKNLKDEHVIFGKKVEGGCKVVLCGDNYVPNKDKNGCVLCSSLDEDECKRRREEASAEYKSSIIDSDTKEAVALKTTVISQQMYKQYEYVSATLRRLKTQLEKAVLTATLQAAGAKSESGTSSLLGGGSSNNSQYRDCTGKNKQGTLDCLRENYSILSNQVNNKKCDKKCKKQIETDRVVLNSVIDKNEEITCKKDDKDMSEKECLQQLNGGFAKLDSIILKEESDRRGYGFR